MARRRIEIDLERVEELAGHGLTLEQIALDLGISVRTLHNRKRDFADFAQAIKKGRARGVVAVANKLWEAVEAGNLTAIIFYLKTRGGWSEKARLDVSGSVGTDRMVPDGLGGWYSVAESEAARQLSTDELLKIAGFDETYRKAVGETFRTQTWPPPSKVGAGRN